MSWLVLALALPALEAAALGLAGPRAGRSATPVAVLTALAALGALLAAGDGASAAPPFLAGLPFAVGLDRLSLLLGVTVCAVTACVAAAVPAQVPQRTARLQAGLLLFLAAVLLTLAARSLLPLLLGWELMGAASWLLIAHDPKDARAAASATTALLTTRALDLGLYLAAGAALAGGASLDLAGLAALHGLPLHLAALGVLAAALGKAAQLPVSAWLARAMDGPSPVSALLHSAAMVAMGGYLLLRTAPLLSASGWADDVAAWTGAATAVVLGVIALASSDLKLLLAASTASQLGLVVVAAGVGATTAGALHLVAHAAVKALLFLLAGLWLALLGTRSLDGLRGAARATPVLGALAAAGLLSLAGLAPLGVWGTKDAVLTAAGERSAALGVAVVLATVLSAGYAVRALRVLLDTGRSAPGRPQPGPGASAVAPLLPLAVAGALGSVLVVPAVGRAVLGRSAEVHLPGLALSAGLGLLGAALAWWRPDLLRGLPGAADWFGLGGLGRAVAVTPVLRLAAALDAGDARLHRHLVLGSATGARLLAAGGSRLERRLDAAVAGTATGTCRAAAGALRLDERGLHPAATGTARLFARLGAGARALQTGQVHQYYGQAAVVLVLAISLLLLLALR